MSETKDNSNDKLAISLCLGGILIAVAIAMLGVFLDKDFSMIAYATFVALEIAALVLGIISRARPLGKTAAITSSILLAASLAVLS